MKTLRNLFILCHAIILSASLNSQANPFRTEDFNHTTLTSKVISDSTEIIKVTVNPIGHPKKVQDYIEKNFTDNYRNETIIKIEANTIEKTERVYEIHTRGYVLGGTYTRIIRVNSDGVEIP